MICSMCSNYNLVVISASGFNVNLVAFILSAICVFYTSVGGFKTVIWTDFLQFGIIMASFIIVYVIGLRLTGGQSLIQISENTRLLSI